MLENARRHLALLAFLAALAPLAVALGAQYLGGLQPCPLCHWQRYPYIAAALLAAVAWWAGQRTNQNRPMQVLLMLAALGLFASAGIGIFHVGVEQGWWEGTSGCTGSIDFSGMSVEEMAAALNETAPARCDEIAWSFLGISMAGYNVIYGAAAGIALALLAARKSVEMA
jgi:disulfide bond formation protein DsbB